MWDEKIKLVCKLFRTDHGQISGHPLEYPWFQISTLWLRWPNLFSKQNYLTITKLNDKLNPSCVWGKKCHKILTLYMVKLIGLVLLTQKTCDNHG